ncbi:hypothetical protein ADICYQ_1130 [Cyclobacterium qasimii M12-11B]|uniref:Uncharacterized protein n=1 Tax=Cyclobacterium qasimii M12-11B TaxID=641524 RepID=S7WT47_9BACT|nr:hypothetical protein ADICYQ_1130 [Cyclobacterium qasimii M12-11B]
MQVSLLIIKKEVSRHDNLAFWANHYRALIIQVNQRGD